LKFISVLMLVKSNCKLGSETIAKKEFPTLQLRRTTVKFAPDTVSKLVLRCAGVFEGLSGILLRECVLLRGTFFLRLPET